MLTSVWRGSPQHTETNRLFNIAIISIGHCEILSGAADKCASYNINLATSICELVTLKVTFNTAEAADTFNQEGGSLIAPMALAHPLHPIDSRGRGTSAETCGLDDVFPPDDLCSRPEALC